MTSKQMRTDPLFMRNEFNVNGKWELPIIRKQDIPLENLQLISYSDTRSSENEENRKYGVHFFIDDYRFVGIYRNPQRTLNKLSQYAFLFSPDNSTYSDMNYWRQLESIAHSRWVGAYWQSCGLTVIPTVSWSDPISYGFCFDGLEKETIVAIGMIGCNKRDFIRGYNAMLERVEPSAVICFGDPFEEMEGNIISVDYLKSRKVVR